MYLLLILCCLPLLYGDVLTRMDRSDFFICDSQIDGMDGHYILSEEIQSDLDTPVFVREDEEEDEIQGQIVSIGDIQHHDFRLYRHNGYWVFADVVPWPPNTVFRCDPTKRHFDINTKEVCQPNQLIPPIVGYSPANTQHFVQHLKLQEIPCDQNTTKDEL